MATAQAGYVSFTPAVHGFIGEVKHAVRRVVAHLNDPNRQGGYFCLVDKGGKGNPLGLPTLILGIGTVPAEKGLKYLAFAQEKAHRLAEHPEHQSSWQSRNEGAEQWGGAIAAGPYVFSFSGLPEHGDEAAMLLAADELGLITPGMAAQIAKESGNEIFRKIVGVG